MKSVTVLSVDGDLCRLLTSLSKPPGSESFSFSPTVPPPFSSSEESGSTGASFSFYGFARPFREHVSASRFRLEESPFGCHDMATKPE